MQTINLIQPVKIVVKVTEAYRQKTVAEIQETLVLIEEQLQQLDFQGRRMLNELEKKNPGGLMSARQHLEREKSITLDSKQKLLEKIKSIGELPLGQEVPQGQMESLIPVQVGEHFQPNLGWEMVLEDDLVVEIRPATGKEKTRG